MPGMMPEEEYDLAGFTVGVVDKTKITGQLRPMQAGDVIIALPSTGVHSNGFSLVRKIFDIGNNADVLDKTLRRAWTSTLGETLLTPTRIYVKPVLAADGRRSRCKRRVPHHRRRLLREHPPQR